MNHTRALKCTDLLFQIACFTIPALATNVMIGWFWFGGAQVFSTLANVLFLPKHLRAATRIGYEVFALFFCSFGAVMLLLQNSTPSAVEGFVWGSCMLSPILAIWYLAITIIEAIKAE